VAAVLRDLLAVAFVLLGLGDPLGRLALLGLLGAVL